MNRSDKMQLMVAGAVLLSLAGFSSAAAWLLQSVLITPELKGLLFFSWLVGIAALFPQPFDKIAYLVIFIVIAIIGIGGFLILGRLWYIINNYIN